MSKRISQSVIGKKYPIKRRFLFLIVSFAILGCAGSNDSAAQSENKIVLKRYRFCQNCSEYIVEIQQSGRVLFRRMSGRFNLIEKEWAVSASSFGALLRQFESVGFVDLPNDITFGNVADRPYEVIGLIRDGREKFVKHEGRLNKLGEEIYTASEAVAKICPSPYLNECLSK